jgi:cation diffusion facilitator CzcD-associated flavoprotein CzcO
MADPGSGGTTQAATTQAATGFSRDLDRDLARRLALPEGAAADPSAPADGEVRHVETLILGGGICGLAAAIGLKRDGREDFLIIERAASLGGTWHHNRYPGCAVDIPSHLYAFSYAMNPDWRRVYVEQPELERYIQSTAARFGLDDHVSLNTELLNARWDEAAQRWQIQTSRGSVCSRFFVIAAGPLHDPVIPDLHGLSSFRGAMFHSANWPGDDRDLSGRRVAVVGTGASAVQFIPRIQPKVAKLTVFQRTPGWVLPKMDWRTSRLERALMRRVPKLMLAVRQAQWRALDLFLMGTVHHPRFAAIGHLFGRINIRRGVKDPQLRRDLTPDYTLTCKRAMFSNEYYPALNETNVEVVSTGVKEVREHSIVGADGTEREIDTIIFGTGFHVITTHPVATRIHGRDGQSLAAYWDGSPRAYMGTSIAGFPNAFMMFGPNVGTLSGFVMAECQVDYLTAALRAMESAGVESIDVTEEAQESFKDEMDRGVEGTTFLVGGCTSYYIDTAGRVALAWPWTMRAMQKRLSRFELSPYDTRVAVPAAAKTAKAAGEVEAAR